MTTTDRAMEPAQQVAPPRFLERKNWRAYTGQIGLLVPIVIFVIAVQAVAPQFLTISNILQVLRQAAAPGIIAIAVTYVVIAGRFDLSVGSILSLTSVLIVSYTNVYGPLTAVCIGLAAGVAVGVVNGFLVGYLNLNSVIGTLGTLSTVQGLTLIFTGGTNVAVKTVDAGGWFAFLGRGYIFGIPTPIIIFALITLVFEVLLKRTTFGRRLFAVGGNETASAFSGIRTGRVVFLTYVISGLMAACAAIIFSSRVMAAQNDGGSGYELTVLAGIILGGTSILGGSGSTIRSAVGVIILAFIQNGLLVAGLPYYAQWIVTWAVIILAVSADMIARRAGGAS